jgi:DNA topoisomerase-3
MLHGLPACPHQIAERLYTSGYLSYPRTESSAYPPNFDFTSILAAQGRHPVWGPYAAALLQAGVTPPKVGHLGMLTWATCQVAQLQCSLL